MNYLPIQLNIKNKKCLIVGSGPVAIRKIKSLLACGAKVKLVSPSASIPIKRLVKNNKIVFKRRVFNKSDLEGIFLVIAASNNKSLNSHISNLSRRKNILVNVVDSKDESDVIFPSFFRKGDLTISVSTQGSSPTLAKRIKGEIELGYGKEFIKFLTLLSDYRKKIIRNIQSIKLRKELFNKITSTSMIKLARDRKTSQLKKRLASLYNKYAHNYVRL